ncbi:hypothetical protein ACBJ59_43710 [Nonomuraea sp. MTCD27]|uniref:hypothetical protein n=1 Tax=Nonomuraea sp. MTCD27 TaxID=1676747 RepID=UPI0035C100EF
MMALLLKAQREGRDLLGLMAGVAPEQAWGVSASGRAGAGVHAVERVSRLVTDAPATR